MSFATVAPIFDNANRLIESGQLSEAIAEYRKATELNPNFYWSYHYLADALVRQGEWHEAIACYQKAINLNPSAAWSHYNLGQAFAHLGHWSEAVSSYRTAAQLNPSYFEFQDSLGQALVKGGLYDEAIACLKKVLELEPNSADAYQNLGTALAGKGQIEEAKTYLRKAIEIKPKSWEAHYQLGQILVQEGYLDQGLACYIEALLVNPNSADLHRNRGYVLGLLNRWLEALDSYQKAAELNPNSATEHHHVGHALAHLNRWDEAIIAYSKAIEIYPDSNVVHSHLGQALEAAERWNEAVVAYRRVLDLTPFAEAVRQDVVDTYSRLGNLLLKLGRWGEAAETYRQVLYYEPHQARFHLKLGDALRQTQNPAQLEEAYQAYSRTIELDRNCVEAYQKALEIKPGNSDFYLSFGDALSQQGETDQAIAIYQDFRASQPQDLGITYRLAETYIRGNLLEEAIAVYQEALQVHPTASDIYHRLGEPLEKQGKLEEAAASYRKAIELNPSYFGSYHNLGDILQRQQKYAEAAVAYRKGIEINPHFHWTHHNLGDVLEKQGLMEEAIAAYRKSIEIEPNFEWSYHNLAKLLTKQGKLDEALVAFRKVSEINPSFQLDYNALQKALLEQIQGGEYMYKLWRDKNAPRPADFRRMAETVEIFSYKPVFSIIMPVYNTPAIFLREAIESVINQIYPYWEFCIADDASKAPHVKEILDEYAAKDARIKVVYRPENGHISKASNSALEVATGEFISLLDHDDVLTPDALYEVALLLNRHPDADLIYSDEDKLNFEGQLINPFFKPEWSPESFLSRMYTCHLGTYRKSIIDEIGGWRIGYEGAQDYDLVLRFTEKTEKIYHIPKILYSWRMHSGSAAGGTDAKPYAYEASKKALQEAIERRGESGTVIGVEGFLGHHLVRYEIKDYKRVSIIIPTRDLGPVVDRCLESIFTKTVYPNYEVILIDNGSVEDYTAQVFAKWKASEPERFKCYRYDIPFNFSKLNNYGVSHAEGDYLLFLNNDTEVIHADWLNAMVEQVQRPGIGAVGALLLFSDNTIQHAGVVMGLGGVAGHSYYRMPSDIPGYFGNFIGFNNVSAVTGACLMCRRDVFEEVGGLDEALTVAYNDVDLCLKMLDRGYRNLYLPHVKLYHHESKSRGYEDTPEKKARLERESNIMSSRWQKYIDNDPCYSPHLTRVCQNFSIKVQD